MNNIDLFLLKFSFNNTVRMNIYRKISSYLDDGVPLNDILVSLSKAYLTTNKNDARGKVLKLLIQSMDTGQSFSEALIPFAPGNEIMLIRSGEESGDVKTAIDNAIFATETVSKIYGAIWANLSYPLVLLCMLVLMIVIFSTQAVPILTEQSDPSTWPDVGQDLYALSEFVIHKWWTVIIGVGGFVIFAKYSIPRLIGKFRDILDYLPPWSIYKNIQSSIFLISLSAMMKTGIPVMDSIKQLRSLSNNYVSLFLGQMLLDLNSGKDLGTALRSPMMSKETGIDILIYADTSNFQMAIERIGMLSMESTIDFIKSAAKKIEFAVMLGIASYMMWSYYAFYTITNSMADAL